VNTSKLPMTRSRAWVVSLFDRDLIAMAYRATVQWIAQHDVQAAMDGAVAIAGVQAWSDRKRQIFKPQHLKAAWDRLQSQGWLA